MARPKKILIGDLIDQFKIDQIREVAPKTFEWYVEYQTPFTKKFGKLAVTALTPGMFSKWVDSYPDASRNNAARAVARVFNWAVDRGKLVASPLCGYKNPAPPRRQFSLTPAQYAICLKHANHLRDVIKFLYHTGCRPQELRAVEARWIFGSKIVLPVSKSKGRKKQRTIFLDSMAEHIVTRLAQLYPNGPIFRNARGGVWTKAGLVTAFYHLRQRTKIRPLCAYQFRHAHITRLLERGIDVATVAALSGNSPQMVLNVYNHVSANENRLLSIVRAGIPA